MANPTRSPVTFRTVAVLATGVLAVHLWLLYSAPARTLPMTAAGPATPAWHVTAPVVTPPTLATPQPTPVRPVSASNPAQALVKSGDSASHSIATATLTAAASPRAAAPSSPMLLTASSAAPPAEPGADTASTAPTTGTDGATSAPASHTADAAIDPALAAQVAALANARVKVPGAVRLNYKIEGKAKGFGFGGKGHLVWQPGAGGDPAAYEAQLVVGNALLGSRSQTSSGRLTSHGLAPTRFADKARSEQAAHFVRDKGQIVFSANAPQAVLMPGAQDRLSVVLQLSSLLAGNPGRFTAGRTLAIQTAGAKDAEVWQFVVVGEETLSLPGGELHTLKLVRKPRHAYDQQIELWFAEKLGFLPARIKLSQVGGNLVDQSWESSETP